MDFTKNEAVILTLIACFLIAFGQLTDGTLSTIASIIGGLLVGITLTADTASEVPDNLKD
jgi:uncharacterized membrane protein